MKIQIEMHVPDSRIKDLLSGHSLTMSDWIHRIDGVIDLNYMIVYDREEDEEGAGGGRAKIDAEKIKAGLQLMATLSPQHWADFIFEDDDAITADIAWQYIVLGKIVYS